MNITEMLTNIKLELNYKDDTKDSLIELYIKKVEANIKIFCNITVVSSDLVSFIETKVANIMRAIDNADKKEAKSISRGDTKIDYDTSTKVNLAAALNLSSEDKRILMKFRKVVIM